MEFWRLCEPEYESDYHHIYVNGTLEHPYGLPGVICETCGETWGTARVLPFACPESLLDRPEMQDAPPIVGSAHRALRAELAGHLGADLDVARLLPGVDLQPGFLAVPSRPVADFLWSSLGSVVVSDRVRALLSREAGDAVAFAPVFLRSVGAGEPDAEPPLPESGEPEDMFDEMDPLEDVSAIGPYWEMIVEAESGLPRGVAELAICPGCGRSVYDTQQRVLAMHDEMWRGAPIFIMATTLWIVVTDELRRKLTGMDATNVAFGRPVDTA